MNKINKAGLIIIFVAFMFDLIMIMVGIKEGKESSIVAFNILMFLVGAFMFGIE